MANHSTAILLRRFQTFYQAVITDKQSIQNQGSVGQEKKVSTIFEGLLSQLRQVELDEDVLQYDGDINFAKEARYIMAVLADEIFLHHCGDWFGREEWNRNLLETKLFGTRSAGTVFFQRIKRLLESRSPQRKTLAALYLYAISFGFRGQYNGREGDKLVQYQEQLYEYLYQGVSVSESNKLIPDAYEYTLVPTRKRRFPSWKPWAIALGVFLLAYVTGSYGAWRLLIDDTLENTEKIHIQTLEIEKKRNPFKLVTNKTDG